MRKTGDRFRIIWTQTVSEDNRQPPGLSKQELLALVGLEALSLVVLAKVASQVVFESRIEGAIFALVACRL